MKQNGIQDAGTRERRVTEMMHVIETEKAAVKRIRTIAFLAWSFAVLLPVGWLGMFYAQFLVRLQPNQSFWARVYLMSPVLGVIGAVCLVLAIITTIAWFFRSRTASLAAIEARLERLERLLSSHPE